MVVKVVGSIDGKEVVFRHNQVTGRWETAVPRDLDGTYVVDLLAYDEAGNIGYAATVLFTVDMESLHAVIEVLKYRLRPVHDAFYLKRVNEGPHLESAGVNYLFVPITERFYLERGHECGLS